MMPLPRRPRGEQPITTIRWQRRQMLQMEQIIAGLKTVIETKDRQLGDFELQLNETGNELFSANEAAEGYRDACDKLEKKCDTISQRLTWYEGFTAGLRTATEIHFPHHPAQTYAIPGSGDQGDIPASRQATAAERKENHPERADNRTGRQISGDEMVHPSDQVQEELAGCKVGAAYDGISRNRYRRTAENDSDPFSGF